ncbi:MAG: hypothetical protein BWY69_00975 [Planctomycetes bacterium ADurb.Bin401]|nr:MAG: hypothetical protein BWY69_00975 [Planctomycetes bacterium ADurb.Bin401]
MAENNKQLNDDRLFSRKKTLLTPQQYASSQGISSGVVEECAKLGVVQIRRHKNKTFIVDLPLDAAKSAKQQEETRVEPINTFQQAQRISGIINKLVKPTVQQTKSAQKVTRPEVVQKPAAPIPDLKIFAQEENIAPAIKHEKFNPVPVEFKISTGRKIQDALTLSTRGKLVFAFLALALVITAAAMVWFGMQNNAQQKRLEQAYENIGKLVNENELTARKAKMLEMDSANWKAEAQQGQQSIASLEIQLVQTKEKLAETQENLSKVQEDHLQTLNQINEQLKEITADTTQTEQK